MVVCVAMGSRLPARDGAEQTQNKVLRLYTSLTAAPLPLNHPKSKLHPGYEHLSLSDNI